MLGLIAGLGLAGYAFHNVKKSNSYKVAKMFEHYIDNGQKVPMVEGFIDENEVIRVMAEDGYDFFKYCKVYD